MFNRLCAVRTLGGTIVATYYYDAENRRVRKEIAGGATTDYLYDGWRVIEERPVVSGVQGAPSQQKVYGNYLDEVLVMDTDADADGVCHESGTDTRHTYHQNSIYSVVAISNADGGVVEAYEYDPYGKHVRLADGDDADAVVNFDGNDARTAMGASLIGNTNTFTGQVFDAESGLHYYKNRYYSCELGRFVSRDLLDTQLIPAANLYAYVSSNPGRNSDPLGLIKFDIDSQSCTAEMKVTLKLNFVGDWSNSGGHTNRKQRFMNIASSRTENTFNSASFRSYPVPKHQPCLGGFSLSLILIISENIGDTPHVNPSLDFSDFSASVQANLACFENPNDPACFLRSGVIIGGAGIFDEGDILMNSKGNGFQQVPFVHEFGHLLGLQHPGQSLNPPAPPNSPADYDPDPSALMGSGMDMRAGYYSRWDDAISAKIGCRYATR